MIALHLIYDILLSIASQLDFSSNAHSFWSPTTEVYSLISSPSHPRTLSTQPRYLMMWANLNKAPPAHYGNRIDRPRSSSSSASSFLEPPPRYSAEDGRDYSDPRQSSQQSLVPSNPDLDDDERRTLLVIYIHGFNGNSQSFRSFPAHVHNFLKSALADTHVVHSKLYPRYKTYRAVEVARDKFSEWLEPHEGPNVDVILVGHSMGGILAADVILIVSYSSVSLRS